METKIGYDIMLRKPDPEPPPLPPLPATAIVNDLSLPFSMDDPNAKTGLWVFFIDLKICALGEVRVIV